MGFHRSAPPSNTNESPYDFSTGVSQLHVYVGSPGKGATSPSSPPRTYSLSLKTALARCGPPRGTGTSSRQRSSRARPSSTARLPMFAGRRIAVRLGTRHNVQSSPPQLRGQGIARLGQRRQAAPRPVLRIQNKASGHLWLALGTKLAAREIEIAAVITGNAEMGLRHFGRHR